MSVDLKLLSVYMNDHLAGATGGVHRVRRMSEVYGGTPLGEPLKQIADELVEERAWLTAQIERLGLGVSTYKVVGAALGEHIARLKPNGRVSRTSPLSALLELEILRSALRGKESGWQTLRVYAVGPDAEVQVDVDRLDAWIAQAERQYETVDRLLTLVRKRALVI
ncbi:hypothetical protein [Sanguibacter sp. 25GB23B1]|uniref:hypothetical protein n=1 Tax=unclassified Sanguibacter TaxID=2645534 RepID=UPI0032B021BD